MATLNTRLTLIQKISQTQDENSWEEFVHYYKRYLYVVVRNMNISHHDTEELIQTVMLKVWDKLKDFQYHPSKGKFRYWLCTIARNSVVDFIRRSQSQQRRRDGLKQEKEVANLNNVELPEVEEIAEREWQNYIANLALESTKKQFNEKHVNCFLLYSEGKTITEVAEALGLSENSVYIYKAKVQESIVREMKRLDHEIG
ncbi:MAG: sigma-70 family RNA polymerase sigma factor [Lentisphaeraceae bacterium]|nr:sigma-70 family RNA polymerase sigma factor [Lentisphaeraceae bacterium]